MNCIWKSVLILNVLYASVSLYEVTDLGDGEDYTDKVYGNRTEENGGWMGEMIPMIYQNFKRYFCTMDDINSYVEHRLIFATNEWRFPTQDVNLTLKYPADNVTSDYFITSMQVFLFYDGRSSSQGYLTGGGLGHDHISVEFIIPSISRLYYQFWVQGINKSHAVYQGTIFNETNICNRYI